MIMQILNKKSWTSLGQVSFVFMLFAIASYFLNINDIQNSFNLWMVSIGASFTALKLNELNTKE